MRRALTVTILTLSLLALAGCNTMRGVGKDIKKAGETIEKTAD